MKWNSRADKGKGTQDTCLSVILDQVRIVYPVKALRDGVKMMAMPEEGICGSAQIYLDPDITRVNEAMSPCGAV